METLVELTRGKLVESVHRGAIALVEATGVVVASVGNIERCVYMRSSAKPLQVVPPEYTDQDTTPLMVDSKDSPFTPAVKKP